MNISDSLMNAKNIVGEDSSIFTRKHYINLISAVIVWFSGFLFAIKLIENPALKIVLYSTIFFLVITLIERMEKYYRSFLTRNILFLMMLSLTAASVLLYRLGYIGYPFIAGFTFFWLAIMYEMQNIKIALLQLAIFLLSPALYLEMIYFSGSFSLVMLVIVSIFISERFLNNSKLDWKNFLIALLFGVTLAAYPLVWLVYIVYLLYRCRSEYRKGIVFVLAMLAVNVLLFFLGEYGYLKISISQIDFIQFMPIWIFILLIVASFYIGWIVADLQEVLFASGLIYFVLFTISLLLKIVQLGWNKEWIDLSLMILAVPFLVLSIKEYKVDRFLGKVLTK
jgi:hypothetical protein